MATEAERRAEEVDRDKAAEIRRMLEQPGGEDEVARRFGKAELSSDEFRAAQRQLREARTRRRESAEARHREVAGQRAQARAREKSAQSDGQTRSGRPGDAVDLRARLKDGRANLAKSDQRAQQARERSRDEVLSQSR